MNVEVIVKMIITERTRQWVVLLFNRLMEGNGRLEKIYHLHYYSPVGNI